MRRYTSALAAVHARLKVAITGIARGDLEAPRCIVASPASPHGVVIRAASSSRERIRIF